MDYKSEAPSTRSEYKGAQIHHKDSEFSLTPTQARLISYLSMGGMYSVADISTALRLCDPRGIISILRRQGVAISDVWCQTSTKIRYKRYFVRKGGVV